MFQHILVPTDGTSFCDKAMNQAIDLAIERDADVVALRVVPHFATNFYDGVIAFSPEDIASEEARCVGAAEDTLQPIVKRARASGVRLTTAVAVADGVADAIIAAAAQHGSDLIVMASHGRSGFSRLLVGSDTDQVLAHSKVPVLVIR